MLVPSRRRLYSDTKRVPNSVARPSRPSISDPASTILLERLASRENISHRAVGSHFCEDVLVCETDLEHNGLPEGDFNLFISGEPGVTSGTSPGLSRHPSQDGDNLDHAVYAINYIPVRTWREGFRWCRQFLTVPCDCNRARSQLTKLLLSDRGLVSCRSSSTRLGRH